MPQDNLERNGLTTITDVYGREVYRPATNNGNAAPKIIKEYFTESVDQESGESEFTRMYECGPLPGQTGSRHFIADKYDETFLPTHGKKMHNPRRVNRYTNSSTSKK